METPRSIREFYNRFRSHCLSHGIYVHAYELFEKQWATGFNPDIVVPHNIRHHFHQWKDLIINVLRKSKLPDLQKETIRSTNNGYHALTALISKTHPSFLLEPILLVADYPYQQPKQSVYDFYSEYNEITWMKRVFFNQQVDIHNDDYVTMFMSRCAHSSYLLSQSRRHREEYFRDVTLRRADPTHIYVHDRRFSFYPSAIPTTIQTYFNYPESPIDNTENKIVAPSKNMQRNYNQIHQLHYLNIPDYEIQDVVINLVGTDDNMKPFVMNFINFKIANYCQNVHLFVNHSLKILH